MTFWTILLWWVISEIVAWGLWFYINFRVRLNKLPPDKLAEAGIAIASYPATQNKILEWVRFVIWPYGIISRTIVINRIFKEVREAEADQK